nr:AlNc14C326G10647 [Albugo laibachii Nc14]|eukprot:CCA25859.1 AlNc14C326G10647 [Albugo laibachii Nc14]
MQLNAQVYPTIRSEMQFGFDFHKPSALKLLDPKSTPSRNVEDTMYRILIARLSRSPSAYIPFARNQSLTRIATVSGTLLMLQMYLSPKSRQLIKSSLQLTSAVTLGSAVFFAVGMQSLPKCKSFLCLLSSHLWSFSHRRGHFLQSHEHGASAKVPWNKKITTSVSLVLVIIFMAKRWKKF